MNFDFFNRNRIDSSSQGVLTKTGAKLMALGASGQAESKGYFFPRETRRAQFSQPLIRPRSYVRA